METFSSASHLKGVVFEHLPPELHPLRDIISDHLQGSGLGGLARNITEQFDETVWQPIPASSNDTGRTVPSNVLKDLKAAFPQDPPGPKQIACVSLKKSGMEFSIYTKSSRDSQISYRGDSKDIRFGRIFAILAEPASEVNGAVTPPPWIIVERYEPLGVADSTRDVYRKHPLIGRNGYNLAEISYDSFARTMDSIRPSQILGHIARCTLEPRLIGPFEKPVFVAVQLDRVGCRLYRRAGF